MKKIILILLVTSITASLFGQSVYIKSYPVMRAKVIKNHRDSIIALVIKPYRGQRDTLHLQIKIPSSSHGESQLDTCGLKKLEVSLLVDNSNYTYTFDRTPPNNLWNLSIHIKTCGNTRSFFLKKSISHEDPLFLRLCHLYDVLQMY